jgi:hypothetical protein
VDQAAWNNLTFEKQLTEKKIVVPMRPCPPTQPAEVWGPWLLYEAYISDLDDWPEVKERKMAVNVARAVNFDDYTSTTQTTMTMVIKKTKET